MPRLFQSFLLCALLVLLAGPASAVGQAVERAPDELWEAFPLEPAPSAAAPEATAPDTAAPRATPSGETPQAPPVSRSQDGTATGTLAALLVAFVGLGGVAWYVGFGRKTGSGAQREARVVPAPMHPADPPPGPAQALWSSKSMSARAASPQVERRTAVPPVTLRQQDSCRIELRGHGVKSYFYAVPQEGGPELARSPYFRVRRGDAENETSAPEALRALTRELTAAGWRANGSGRAPWDLRFERGAAERRFERSTAGHALARE